jgi:hypothetical protein
MTGPGIIALWITLLVFSVTIIAWSQVASCSRRRKPQIGPDEALERVTLYLVLFCAAGLCLYAMGVHA